jgi:hypothetical protein
MNKKRKGIAYYSTKKSAFCTPISDTKYRNLTTGEEFDETDGDTIRQIAPEDLLDSAIVLESSPDGECSYVRISYCDVVETRKINELISVDIDKNGKLIGLKLNYKFN